MDFADFTPLSIVFLLAFIGSLVLAVVAMLHGVEHTRPNRTRAPSAFFNLPSYAAFGSGFGVVGYLLSSRTRLANWAVLLIAIAAGTIAVTGMITLLATWALRGAKPGATDDREIQGQFAIVTRALQSDDSGEISYEAFGTKVKMPAIAISGKQVPVGAEVVIDRVKNGVALVEEWAVVEQRI